MNVHFVTWDPSASDVSVGDFGVMMKKVLRQEDDALVAYFWPVPRGCGVEVGDVIFVLRREGGETRGVAMVALVVALSCPARKAGDGFSPLGVQPIYMFDVERYDVLSAGQLAKCVPAVDWEGLEGGATLDDEMGERVVNLWVDYLLAHFDTISGRTKRPRSPKAVTLFDVPEFLSFVPGVYPILYRRFHHRCDICGFDFDYVFQRLDYMPHIQYLATLRKGFKPGSPDYRSAICVCGNCWPLLRRNIPLVELRDKVRPVSCDVSALPLQVVLGPGRLLN